MRLMKFALMCISLVQAGGSFAASDINMLNDYEKKSGVDRYKTGAYFFGVQNSPGTLLRAPGSNYVTKRDSILKGLGYEKLNKPLFYDYYLLNYDRVTKEYDKEYYTLLNQQVSLVNLWVGQTIRYKLAPNFKGNYGLSAVTTIEFLGHDIVLKNNRGDVDVRQMQMASGINEIDSFYSAVVSNRSTTLSKYREKGMCSAADLLELDWKNDSVVNNLHPAIAKILAKLDTGSIHDYNLDLTKYLESKRLIVKNKAAKKSLSKKLANRGIKASVVIAPNLSTLMPVDDGYFLVARTDDEIESINDDYWGKEQDLLELYSHRAISMDDIRLVSNDAGMADVIKQIIDKKRSLRDCRLSLI
ncbi:hypothetical protein [Marinomonas sp. 2405UD68-3]|uniref:hypothetical protein n=1 Tax=Marinomonas sp. 2405UD68-3 TaxID=3391835 RepID=UPI0039C9679B